MPGGGRPVQRRWRGAAGGLILPGVSLNLSSGEQVIFQGHPSWRAILGFYLKGVLVAVVLGVIAKLIWDNWTAFVVILAVIAVTVLVGFVKRVATTYTITNRRLNIKRGIVSREIQETRLERVQNVNYRQSVFQRVMQIGDVDFDTAATDDYNFVFYGVADPGEVVHRVDQATGAGFAGSHGLGEAQSPGSEEHT
jgi:membrane protein YdbS with pleckstrin-like domain